MKYNDCLIYFRAYNGTEIKLKLAKSTRYWVSIKKPKQKIFKVSFYTLVEAYKYLSIRFEDWFSRHARILSNG